MRKPRSDRVMLSFALTAREGIATSSLPPTLMTLLPGVLMVAALVAAALAEPAAAEAEFAAAVADPAASAALAAAATAGDWPRTRSIALGSPSDSGEDGVDLRCRVGLRNVALGFEPCGFDYRRDLRPG